MPAKVKTRRSRGDAAAGGNKPSTQAPGESAALPRETAPALLRGRGCSRAGTLQTGTTANYLGFPLCLFVCSLQTAGGKKKKSPFDPTKSCFFLPHNETPRGCCPPHLSAQKPSVGPAAEQRPIAATLFNLASGNIQKTRKHRFSERAPQLP